MNDVVIYIFHYYASECVCAWCFFSIMHHMASSHKWLKKQYHQPFSMSSSEAFFPHPHFMLSDSLIFNAAFICIHALPIFIFFLYVINATIVQWCSSLPCWLFLITQRTICICYIYTYMYVYFYAFHVYYNNNNDNSICLICLCVQNHVHIVRSVVR